MWHELPLLLEFARTVLLYSLWQLRSGTERCCSFHHFVIAHVACLYDFPVCTC